MEEKRPETPSRISNPATPQRPSPSQNAALYLRWLGILCAIMATFCAGIFLIGYKDPSVGRIATLVALVIASVTSFWLSRRKSDK